MDTMTTYTSPCTEFAGVQYGWNQLKRQAEAKGVSTVGRRMAREVSHESA